MSNLASIQKIVSVAPIEGADAIEKVTVLGWDVVCKKGEYQPGDLCCYIQIDTVVPDKPEYEFLRERKFRVRTIKLRGQVSQGLIVPLPAGKWKEGDDATAATGVTKYEKPDTNPIARYEKPRAPKAWHKKLVYLFKYNILYKWFPGLRPKLRSPFPTSLVSITDEERIQNMPAVLKAYAGKLFSVSWKLDGSSITVIHNRVMGKSRFRICSRRFELHDKKNEWYQVFTETGFSQHIIALVRHFGTDDIIVQGEAIGKFNGNHHGLDKNEIRLFNIYVKGKRLLPSDFTATVTELNIPHCPALFENLPMEHTLEEVLALSQRKDMLNPKVECEGLVWRCHEDNLSFKAINNAYLLKEK